MAFQNFKGLFHPLALLVLFCCWPGSLLAREQATPDGPAVIMEISGAIGPATTEYLENGLEAAQEAGASLVVLRIDTPGGLVSSTRDIVRMILASPVPVIAYVAPSGARAASAGTYIVYASHLAAMAPGTNLGAATPISLGGGGVQPSGEDGGQDGEGQSGEEEAPIPAGAASAKVVNDAVAFIRSLAELRGRNVDFAESAVRWAESISASQALERDVVEIIATDIPDLLAQADGRTVEVAGETVTLHTAGLPLIEREPGFRAQFLSIITDPNIAYILLLVGIYGILFEFLSPGIVFSGVIGAISLLIGLFALNLLPINLAGAGLMLLGAALMAAETFVTSFGILGLGGIAAFAAGSLFLFEEVPGFSLSLSVIMTASAVSAGLLILMLAAVLRAHRRSVTTGEAELIGAVGKVLSWSGSTGQIHIHGERWQARSAEPLAPGERVRVTRRDKLTLTVELENMPPPS